MAVGVALGPVVSVSVIVALGVFVAVSSWAAGAGVDGEKFTGQQEVKKASVEQIKGSVKKIGDELKKLFK